MRIDVNKFVFMGLQEEKAAFFQDAQKLGIIQFQETKKEITNKEIQTYVEAIRIVRALPPLEQVEGDAYECALEIIKLNQEQSSSLVSPEVGNYVVQFFSGKTDHPDLIEISQDRYMSVTRAPVSYSGMTEIKISVPDPAKIEALKQMAAYNNILHQGLIEAINKAHLARVENSAKDPMNNLFSITGWVPVDKVPLLKDLGVFVSEVAVSSDDVVPTHLENEKLSKIGEDVIGIYDTPSTQDQDPSLWVLIGFIVFFSIIIGDGGYGSVYLGSALFIRYKFPDLQGVKKRMLNLATYLSVGCIIWGLLTSSFFGIDINPDNPIRSFSLVHYLASYKNGETNEILLEIALFIGVIHLMTGMLRYMGRNPGNIGWIIFLIGSYLYFPVFLDTPSLLNYFFGIPFAVGGEVGLQMIMCGIAWAVGFSVYRNGLIGLTEVMTLVQVFADGLSYLRLYALGLSGSILSSTINSMSSHMPFLLAIVLIVLGHLINMMLGIMGGVIHGLRLNFLEWYHYSFEGGGRKFKPLKINELE